MNQLATQESKMDELRKYVDTHVVRGDCQCGHCIDAKEHPEQPTGHTANMVFFHVAAGNKPDAKKLQELVVGSFKGDFCNVDIFDGKEHGYLELGGWIGDQGMALMLMGLGSLLGLWKLLTPISIMHLKEDDPLCQQMAGMGLVSIQAKKVG